jgi:hypothetical protein
LRRIRRDAANLIDSNADFFGGTRSDRVDAKAGKRCEPRDYPMTFVNRLSVVTAYVALAFVGAIVLGVF